MRVRVYIEVVIINNLALDALLVCAALMIRREKLILWRVFVSSAIGSAAATAYPIAPLPAQIAIRALLAPIICACICKYKSFKEYIITLMVFVALTFVLGGTVYGISHMAGLDIRGYISLGITAFAALALLLAVKAFCAKRGKISRRICDTKLNVGGNVITVKSMCDTGNSLTDAYSGLPVVLVSKELENKLKALDSLKNGNKLKNICALKTDGETNSERLEDIGQIKSDSDAAVKEGASIKIEGFIEIETVSGKGILPIVDLGEIAVGNRKINALGGLSRKSFDGYDLILQNTMF